MANESALALLFVVWLIGSKRMQGRKNQVAYSVINKALATETLEKRKLSIVEIQAG